LRRLLSDSGRVDEVAARVVVERVVPRLARFLLHAFPMLPHEDAVDLAGGALTIALERHGRFVPDGRSEARTWLYGIAKRHTLEFLRKRGTVVTLSEAWPVREEETDSHAPSSTLEQAALDAILALPEQQRRAALDHYLGDISAAEIDRLYGWKPNTAHVYLARARAAVRRRLTSQGFPPGAGDRNEAPRV